MPELSTITVKGFRSIESIEHLELGAINVLIGANGSGKSNFTSVFSFLHNVRLGHLQDYVRGEGGANRILHFGSSVTNEMEILVSFRGGQNQYLVRLKTGGNDQLSPSSERVAYWNQPDLKEPLCVDLLPVGYEAAISGDATELGADAAGIARYVQRRLDSWRKYHFHDTGASSPMKRTADINDNRFFRPDASNLPAFLYYLQEKHQSSYHLIREVVREVAPFFDDFVLEPQRLNADKIQLE